MEEQERTKAHWDALELMTAFSTFGQELDHMERKHSFKDHDYFYRTLAKTASAKDLTDICKGIRGQIRRLEQILKIMEGERPNKGLSRWRIGG